VSVVTVSLPGLSPSDAQDLVHMALAEWRMTRETGNYVEVRYAEHPETFRRRRHARLARELEALGQMQLDARPDPLPQVPRCACCGTTENLHADVGSGGPFRCDSPECMVF
jgi:hypothetical protein